MCTVIVNASWYVRQPIVVWIGVVVGQLLITHCVRVAPGILHTIATAINGWTCVQA